MFLALEKMEKWCFLVVLFVLMFGPWVNGGMAMAYRSQDGTEEWGYVEVRPRCFRSWHWEFSRDWAAWNRFEAQKFYMVEKSRSVVCG